MSKLQVPTGFERLVKRYDDEGVPYQISVRPYYSSGAFEYEVVDTQLDAAGNTKLFLLAEEGQEIDFFSYAITYAVAAVRLGADPRVATFADTNCVTRSRTNDEDFVIEGISATSRGTVAIYPGATDGAGGPPIGADADNPWNQAVVQGNYTYEDIGSNLQPAEISSPLALEDALFRSMLPLCEIRTTWGRKDGDFLGVVDQYPEGGAKSYLRSSGTPDVFNYSRIKEGYIWNRVGNAVDTLLGITAKLRLPHLFLVTLPAAFTGVEGLDLGDLGSVRLVWKLRLHGKAFYYPSKNA
jgi:hypothetical protein